MVVKGKIVHVYNAGGFGAQCPMCNNLLAHGQYAVTMHYMLVSVDPPPICCATQRLVPLVFATQEEAEKEADNLQEKLRRGGETFVLIPFYGEGRWTAEALGDDNIELNF